MQKHLLGYRDNLMVEVGPGFACGGGTLVGRQTWNRAKLLVRMAQLFSAIAPSVSIYETVVGPTPNAPETNVQEQTALAMPAASDFIVR